MPNSWISPDLIAQLSLFSDRSASLEGLRYVAEFISPEEERDLIARFATLPLQPFQYGQFEGKRRVTSFGFSYDYGLRRLGKADPIPSWIEPLIERVERFGGTGTQIAQVLCTQYETGVGIGWHRVKPHFGEIFGVSLGSSCKLRSRRS